MKSGILETMSRIFRVLKPTRPSPSPPTVDTYSEALSLCVDRGGYQEQDLVDIIVAKNMLYLEKSRQNPVLGQEDWRTVMGLVAAERGESLRVVDFGGGAGNHFTIAQVVLGTDRGLRWNVVETPAMAISARPLERDGLRFFDDLLKARDDLGEIDLVFAVSSLQYTSDPLEYLQKIISVKPKHIFITRTPMSLARQVSSVQTSRLFANGPGPAPAGRPDRLVNYPITFVSKAAVERLLQEEYQIRFETREEGGSFRAGAEKFDMFGFFCDRKR